MFQDHIAELFSFERGVHIVIYADDIILITSSVSKLQEALSICQRNLENLDMSVNAKKTCCLYALVPGLMSVVRVFRH